MIRKAKKEIQAKIKEMGGMKLWKVFKAGLKSNNGDIQWEIGEWQEHKGALVMCEAGFHASERIIDAMEYTDIEQIALVEVRGKNIKGKNKQVWEKMRILKVWEWKKEDNVALAVFAAEMVLLIFEKEYPQDKRPRKAIETAKNWLANPTREAARAAWAASEAAWAASEAAWAAWAASEAAKAASEAASEAARAASEAARAAKAASEATSEACEIFILKRIGVKK